MLFGYRDEFEYIECAECGCLQIKAIPDNIEKYYPENYYSLQPQQDSRDNFLKSFLKRQRAKYAIGERNITGMISGMIYGIPEHLGYLKKVPFLRLDSSILDVGCGTGGLLLKMRRDGFSNLTGIDPFIKDDIFYECGVRILKRSIFEMEQQFDFIMLIHSFEHMPKPLLVFKQLYNILKNDRYVLIAIPIVSPYGWKKYGINWFALEAPRHFFLYTIKAVQILAEKAGFEVSDIVFDSPDFYLIASEQYMRDIPFMDNHSYFINPQDSIFSEEQIEAFKNLASELKKNDDDYSACFYLYKRG